MKLFLYCFRPFDETPYYDALAKQYGYTYEWTEAYPDISNVSLAAGADAVSTTVCQLNAEVLAGWKAAGVGSLITRSIGTDHIDLDLCRSLGLHVAHVAYPPESVAEYTLMLLLMGLRRMRQTMERALIQDYTLKGKIGKDLCECTVGIVGTGRIGAAVAARLSAFGTRLLLCDPVKNPALPALGEYVPLDTLLRESDAVTLHMPSTADTFHMIGRAAFEKMKKGALLVNTARGTLVDTEALIHALESGHLGGACLDVIEDEYGLYYLDRVGQCLPNRQMAVLRALPNVILTPHTAFYTERTVRSMAEQVTLCMTDICVGNANPLILL